MPIKTFRSQEGSIRTGSTGTQASASAFQQGAGPEATARIQQGVGKLIDNLGDVLEDQENVWATDSNIQMQKDIAVKQKEWQATGANSSQVAAEFKSYTEKVYKSAPTPRAGNSFLASAQPMSVSLFRGALSNEARKRTSDYVGQSQKNIDTINDMVKEDPTSLAQALNLIVDSTQTYAKNTPVLNPVFEQQSNTAQQVAVVTAVDSALSKDAFMARMISAPGHRPGDGIFDDFHNESPVTVTEDSPLSLLDPNIAQAKAEQINKAVGTQRAATQQHWTDLRKANLKSVSETGIMADGYSVDRDAAFNSKTGEKAVALKMKLNDQLQEAKEAYSLKSALFGVNHADAESRLEAAKPIAGDPNFDNKLRTYKAGKKALDVMRKSLAKDSYEYTMQSPVVLGHQARANSYFTEAQEAQNPQAKARLMSQGQEELSFGLNASIDIQTRAGVPPAQISVMSKQMASDYATTIREGLSKEGLSALANVEQAYGQHADKAFSDMQRLPSDGAKLEPKYMAVAAHLDNPAVAKVLLDSMKLDTTKKGDKESLTNSRLDASTVTSISKATFNDPIFRSYMGATAGSSGNTEYAVGVREAINSYAKHLFATAAPGSDTPEAAAAQASKVIIGSLYAFDTSPNGAEYAIPRKGLSDEEVELTQEGLKLIHSDMEEGDAFSADIVKDNPNVPDSYFLNGLRQKAYWVNSPDNSGVFMYVNSPEAMALGMAGLPLKRKDGGRVFVSFDTAREKGKSKPSGFMMFLLPSIGMPGGMAP